MHSLKPVRDSRVIGLGSIILLLLLSALSPALVAFAAGVPTATLNVPPSGFIGEPLTFTVAFDNTSTSDVGYGPYIDLALPAAGADGAGAATDDGITFTNATYLGTPVTPVIKPFICSSTGSYTHPLTKQATSCVPDTQIIILQPPYGSFTATQPPAVITINTAVSNLADVGTALPITAQAGFYLGNDPLDNPATDPPIPGAQTSATFTPVLFKLSKSYLGPENETATGPNFVRQYQIAVDVADGQTITNMDLTDALPDSLQFLSVDSVITKVGTAAVTSVATPSTTTPGGTLTRRIASVTGTAEADDAEMVFSFYVPRLDASNNVIINPITGDDVPSENNTRTSGSWTPIDTRDAAQTVSADPPGPEHVLIDKSIAIQKSVENVSDQANSPGDVLEYTLNIQISDFFALQNLVVNDTFSDGQHFDPSFTPQLLVNGNPFALAAANINTNNYTVAQNFTGATASPPNYTIDPAANDGKTTVMFRLSNELITRGENGMLIGGCVQADGSGLVPCPGDGATTAQIRFRTIIQKQFTDDYPSTEPVVDEGDILNNVVTVQGDVLNNVGLTPTGQSEDDDSNASLEIARNTIKKTVYAINGDTACPPINDCTKAIVAPGDTVTYRLELDTPFSTIEDLKLIDYLPLPIFDVDNNTAPIVSRITSFSPTVSAAVPAAGTAKFGPTDTLYTRFGVTPFNAATANNSVANSVTFDYGTLNDPANQAGKIDILFTVTASYAPFADQLLLTNQLREQQGSTNNGTQIQDAIVQVKINEPALNIRKGIVAIDDPAAIYAPTTKLPAGVAATASAACNTRLSGTVTSANLPGTFDSNVSNVDANDQIMYAIVVQNTGSGPDGAFDVKIKDALPAGVVLVPGSVCANDGTGAAFTTSGDLFSSGLELADPGPTANPSGALDSGMNRLSGVQINDGHNIAIITYLATIATTVTPGQTLVNTATLFNYSSGEGGDDFTIVDQSDPAQATVLVPEATKLFVATSEASTPDAPTPPRTAVGEIVRYRLAVKIPEGTTSGNVQLQDTLPLGLTFLNDGSAKVAFVSEGGISSSTLSGVPTVSADSVALADLPSSAITGALPDNAISNSPTANNDSYGSGTDVFFSLGTLSNADNDNNAEYAVVEFNAIVDNDVASNNTAGTVLPNGLLVQIGGTQVGSPAAAVSVRVVEPALTLTKVIVTPASAQGDAGDTVAYRVTYTNASSGDVSTAFDTLLNDPLPASLALNVASVTVTPAGGATGVTNNSSGNTVAVTIDSIPPGGSVTVDYSATLQVSVAPAQTIQNTAKITYTSIPGIYGTTPNPTGSLVAGAAGSAIGERNGSGGINKYAATKSTTLTVPTPVSAKTLVATSETSTTGSNVAIGEIVRYRLAVQLPEGTSTNVQLHDILPAGLTFLNDNTAKVAFVSNGGLGSSTLSGVPNFNVSSASVSDVPLSSVTGALPDAAISSNASTNNDTYASGTGVYFSLGTLTNADSDADNEYVIVDFNTVVNNIASNVAGTNRDNSMQLLINGTLRGNAPSTSVLIVEPALTQTKAITNPASGQGDAGDTVTYRVTYTNATGANVSTAFDTLLVDVLPNSLQLDPSSLAVTLSGGATGITNATSGNTVSIGIAVIPPGGTVQVQYTATVQNTVSSGQMILNTAKLTYTSLPGPNGTTTNATGSATPGAAGSITGERTGAGTSPNIYTTSKTATFTVFLPAPVKSIIATSEASTTGSNLAIGEIVRYRVVTRVAEGNSPNFQLRDILPTGLIFLNDGTAKVALASTDPGLSSSTLTGAGIQAFPYNETNVASVTPTFVVPSSAISGGTGGGGAFQTGDDPLFSLGNLTNTDNDTDQELVVLEFNALVDNTATGSNDAGDALSNTVIARINGSDLATSPAVAATVVEPQITLAKTVAVTPPVKAGDTVTYTIVATNSSAATSTTAFDVRVLDTLDSNLTLQSAVITAKPVYANPTNSTSAPNVDIAIDQLKPGDSVTIQVTAKINTVSASGQTTPNSATATYTSLPGPNGTTANATSSATTGAAGSGTGERNGSGGINDYTASANAPLALGSLGDTVWYDIDGNGALNGSEKGLSGVTVKLTLPGPNGTLGDGDDVTVTTTTGANGVYQFTGLPATTYRVSVDTTTLPAGFTVATYDLDGTGTASTTSVALAAAQNRTDVDFGYRGTGTIGDFVWFDTNGDGVYNTGEPALPNVKLTLIWGGQDGMIGNADDITFTQNTNASGGYNFTNLPAGNYRVIVDPTTAPAGTTLTTGNNPLNLTLASGQTFTTADFGFTGTGSIGDLVWLDRNNNGTLDGDETGLSGVGVSVVWAGLDGMLGNADDITYTTTTNTSGLYNVGKLPAGPYRVTVKTATLPAGVIPTYDLDGTGTASTAATTLTAGQNRIDLDFGYQGTSSIGDFVWLDRNGDGVQDAGEPGLPNIPVTLTWYGPDGVAGGGDDATFTQNTNITGGYSFAGLPAGTYSVAINAAGVPAGLALTTNNNPLVITLAANTAYTTADFGYQGTGSLGDRVWLDLNSNGVQNAGEPGIVGATVNLVWYGADGVAGGNDDVNYTTTTGADGAYSFAKLPAGNFRVSVVPASLPTGVSTTYDLDGVATASTTAVNLAAMQNRTDVDFGYAGTGKIGDFVWFDKNGNGTYQAGEPALPNIPVTLTWAGKDGIFGNADDATLTQTTNVSGGYNFVGLPAGKYIVDVDETKAPAGTTLTTNNDLLAVTLTTGQVVDTADFGFAGTGSLGDFVWLDRNGDKLQGADEPGISGVGVNVIWAGLDGNLGTADDITYTTTTNTSGLYSIGKLPAGPYRVNVTTGLPAGLNPTFDLDGIATASTADTALTAMQNRVDADFGYQGTSSIGDLVWLDRNGDGVYNAGEPGLPNIPVTLTWYGPDGVVGGGDDATFTQNTDANGGYTFAGLPAGTYSVAINAAGVPAGLALTTNNNPLTITLAANTAYTTADFGYQGTGSLGDRVWQDLNGNGVQNAGEPGIVGATVKLVWYGADGVVGGGDDVNYTTTTGANGVYSFAKLPAGNFRATVDTSTLPAGFTNATYDLDGGNDSTAAATLAVMENRIDVDFGYQGSGSIGNFVWLDKNGDGKQDAGEPGLPNVKITLTWAGPDGIAGNTDDVTYIQNTDTNGMYNFVGLPAGKYTVDVDQTTAPTGTKLTTGNDPLSVTLIGGQVFDTADFGFTGTGSLGDRVWLDRNGNATQDGGEPGIVGIGVTVTWAGPDGALGNADDASYTTTTGTNGSYLVDKLPAGPYRVTVNTATLSTGINPTYDLDGIATASTADTALTAGQNRVDADFGYQGTGAIGNFVWLDRNGDGVQDVGEPGLPNIPVKLTWYGPDGIAGNADDTTFTQNTDANGGYNFTGLPAGNYSASIDPATLPAGLTATFDLDGIATPSTTTVKLAAGQSNPDVDFGYQGTGSLGDRVWLDLNSNSAQDNGEPGIVGATVNLVWYGADGVAGGNDDVNYTTTTGADGAYSFGKLPAGNFRVSIDPASLPTGVSATYDLDGVATVSTTAATLTSGQNRIDVDFGYVGTGQIGDFVWLDKNGDGTYQAGELGLPNIPVTLTWAGKDGIFGNADDETLTQITNTAGNYTFVGLPAGNYTVDVDQTKAPTGTTLTTNNDPLNVTLTTGQVFSTADFGFTGSGAIGNFVWLDINGNNVQDADEPGISGVGINVIWAGPDGVPGNADDVSYPATTDSSGHYQVGKLPVGSYRIDVNTATLPAGVTATFDLNGGNDSTTTTALVTGQQRDDVDFGYVGNASIGDFVWLDKNGDGVQDAGEPGLENIPVTLTWYGPDGIAGNADDATFTQTTDTNGGYSFVGLPAGNYTVDVDQTKAPAGTVLTTNNDPLNVTLTAGKVFDTADFGFTGTGSIGDFVWNDANNNGQLDNSEVGLSGVGLTATWAGPDGVFGTTDDTAYTTSTDTNGIYHVGKLPAGPYRVDVDTTTVPAGLNPSFDIDGTTTASTSTIALTAGQTRTDLDFGYSQLAPVATGVIGDRVWLDTNGDGVQNAGEPGIAGVTVRFTGAGADGVFGTADDVTNVPAQTTDNNGLYQFNNLPPGLYRITVDNSTLPAGLGESHELDGSLNGSTDVTLAAGQIQRDVDFGYTSTNAGAATSSIGDRVWNDANGNGVQDAGEAGIAGITLTLTWAGPDGVLGNADDKTYTMTTDTNGLYTFAALPAGVFSLVLDHSTVPAGLNASYELDGSRDGQVTLVLANGQSRSDVDFGFTTQPVSVPTGAIGDRVWQDVNGNGVQDAGEPGISGVTVNLVWYGPDGVAGNGDDVAYVATTGANGIYNVPGLPAGTYAVSIDPATLPVGLVATFDVDGGNNGAAVITLANGQQRTDVDFGYRGTGSIGDRVWNDANANRLQDGSETGITGVNVTLTWAGADGAFGTADDVTRTTITGTDGNYTFTNLPAGSYRVHVEGAPLNGLNETYELDGSLDATTTIALAAGQSRTNVDFGYTALALGALGSIGNHVWLDLDGNGAQNGTEPGLSNVTVNLQSAGADNTFGTADDVIYTQVTDANGAYSFSGLPAGQYRVNVDTGTLPDGLAATFDLDGGADSSADLTLAAGQNVADADFGYRGAASLGDFVWNDANGNGAQDAGESGISGALVRLTWTGPDGVLGTRDDLSFTTNTASDGSYHFDNLPVGTYQVSIDAASLPTGMTPTFDRDGGLDSITSVGLTSGQQRDNLDFGFVVPAIDLVIAKRDNGAVNAGGTVVYTLVYTNAGNFAADGVVIRETVPANTTFNAAASTAGWTCAATTAGSACTFPLGTLARTAHGQITFAVTAARPVPAGVNALNNTATIADNGAHGADTVPANNSSSVTTTLIAVPDLELHKSDGGIKIKAGSLITYTLTYTNVGTQNATGVVINETVPDHTTFNAAASTPGWTCAGTTAGKACTFPVGALNVGKQGSVRFVVTVTVVDTINNTATIIDDGANGDDPTGPGDAVDNNVSSVTTTTAPTAITLASFTATRESSGIVVRWTTTQEQRTLGFRVYRSVDGTRAHATLVTPTLLPSKGRSDGASYSWTDTNAPAGATYTYWLEELDADGSSSFYGPATTRVLTQNAAQIYRFFIPFVKR